MISFVNVYLRLAVMPLCTCYSAYLQGWVKGCWGLKQGQFLLG